MRLLRRNEVQQGGPDDGCAGGIRPLKRPRGGTRLGPRRRARRSALELTQQVDRLRRPFSKCSVPGTETALLTGISYPRLDDLPASRAPLMHDDAGCREQRSPNDEEGLMASEDSNRRGGGPGNFANELGKSSEARRKGGKHSHQGSGGQSADRSHRSGSESSGGQQRGGSGNFANDPDKASEAGRKGGQHPPQGTA